MLCQRNNNTNLLTNNVSVTRSNYGKCKACVLIFKTESSLKVHNDLVHQKENLSKEDLKYKHCNITCSYSEVMMIHNEQEHKFKCNICNETFKEESVLKIHSRTNYAQIPITIKIKIDPSGGSIPLLV